MDPNRIAKQMIDFQKTAFDNTYHSMIMLQDHTEKLTNTFFEQATWIPAEGSRAITEWIEVLKKGRSDYKVAVDDAYSKMSELLAD